MVGQQSVRQAARRATVQAQSRRAKDRAVRERRLSGLAVEVVVAVSEREAAVDRWDRRAGEALRVMTEVEGLSLREAAAWCEGLSTREATRLRRLALAGEIPSSAALGGTDVPRP